MKGLFFGVGAVAKLGEILDDIKPTHIGIITSQNAYKKCGAWDSIMTAIKSRNIEFTHFDKVFENPTIQCVDAAAAMFRPVVTDKFLVLAVGGGSVGDVAKAVSVLTHPIHHEHDARTLYNKKAEIKARTGLVIVNTTHGTGTEVDHLAVASILDG